MLNTLSDYIYQNKYPIKIALENNRKMPDNSIGDSMAFVTEIVTQVNRKNIGICFDMGHYAWYTANHTDTPNLIPPKEFLSKETIKIGEEIVNTLRKKFEEWGLSTTL